MTNSITNSVERIQHVFVTIAGGVGYVARAPENIEVHIIDYDDLKADFDETFKGLSPEAQSFYREMETATNKLAAD